MHNRAIRKKMSHQRKLVLLALACGMPGLLASIILLLTGNYAPKVHLTVITFIVVFWFICVYALVEGITRPLQTASNMLSALREGDYSMQSRRRGGEDPLSQVMYEINELTSVMREQRMEAREATTLLSKVVEEIDVVVITFDEHDCVATINRMGEKLTGKKASELRGLTLQVFSEGLGLTLQSGEYCMVDPRQEGGRWYIKSGFFRVGGKPHRLLIMTDMSQPLRQEERMAWKRLIRVLGHELNNSMAPISSLTDSMQKMLARNSLPETREDIQAGLEIIRTRAAGLSRFMEDYSRLAKLPAPRREKIRLRPILERVAALETRMEIGLCEGAEVTLKADPSQLEQMFINLVKNAVEASIPAQGSVNLLCNESDGMAEIRILDEGVGIANPENIFIPFFSTKKGGSGIGLMLSREIVENHNGSLRLRNRDDRQGCEAIVRLPIAIEES